MVRGIVHQTIGRVDDSLCAPGTLTQSANIALIVGVSSGEQAFVIVESVTADAFARCVSLQWTTGPAQGLRLSLGDIIIGEPEAYIAFAGKRVIEQVMKIEVPPGIQEAEYLFEKGSLDSIVPRNLLKGVLSELFKFHPSLILKAMRKKRNWRVWILNRKN